MAVENFPAKTRPSLLVGPFHEHRVVVDGRFVPNLTGHQSNGNVTLVVDHRFGIDVPEDIAPQVAWLVAQAMAVCSGYPHFSADSKDAPFAAKAMEVSLEARSCSSVSELRADAARGTGSLLCPEDTTP